MFRKLFFIALCTLLFHSTAFAQVLNIPETVTQNDLNQNIPQPYIVKKGDTLWDIANYFFKEPKKWLNIWEKNLYITNPDLIYPGNKIWFRPKTAQNHQVQEVQQAVSMRIERPKPKVIIKPVERLTPPKNSKTLMTALMHQDFIAPHSDKGVGYVVGARDDRLNFGMNDVIYLNITYPVHIGDRFDVFREDDPIWNVSHEKVVGLLVEHLGVVKILSEEQGVYRAQITQGFKEIMRGDRIKPATIIDPNITPEAAKQHIVGRVLYIQNHGSAAGENQVIGINRGLGDGLKTGTILSIYRPGRRVMDATKEHMTMLPNEHIADIMVLKAQRDASLCLVTDSTSAIHLGDLVRNPSHH